MNTVNSSRPLWFYLLEEQGKHAWGLTPSYLIGAEMQNPETLLDVGAAYGKLCSLLESFSTAPEGYLVVISPCNIHGQPIAGLYALDEAKPDCEAVINHRGKHTTLYADRGYFAAEKRTFDSLTTVLWKIFESHLTAGEYSYGAKGYSAFSNADRQSIARSKERLETAQS